VQQGEALLYFSTTNYFEILKEIKLQGGNSPAYIAKDKYIKCCFS
jgi:hypothetical protein